MSSPTRAGRSFKIPREKGGAPFELGGHEELRNTV